MEEYLKAISDTNSLILKGRIDSAEVNSFAQADRRWANHRGNRKGNFSPVKKGEIYQFEFGKNYIPEMSYEHRGMVIGIRRKLLYVLPVFSFLTKYQNNLFHPTANPQGDLFFLKQSDYSFLRRDSVMKLNDIRTVSVERILYFQNGRIDVESETYKTIVKLVLEKYFFDFSYELRQLRQENETLKRRIEGLTARMEHLNREEGKSS